MELQCTINDFCTDCHEIAKSKGWYDKPRDDPELIALEHSELSEALEACRHPGLSEKIPEFSKLEEELADAMIRIADHAGYRKLRLGDAIAAKMKYNADRGYRHGGKKY